MQRFFNEELNVKAMFVSQERVDKKKFQKPNILRRKLKAVPRSGISKANVAPETKSLVINIENVDKAIISNPSKQTIICGSAQKSTSTDTDFKLNLESNYEHNVDELQETDIDANINACITSNILGSNDVNKNYEHSSLNVESFINVTASEQSLPISLLESTVAVENNLVGNKIKWAFDLSDSSRVDVFSNYNVGNYVEADIKQEKVTSLLATTESCDQNFTRHPVEIICNSTPPPVELFSNRAVKLKCDEPNCDKGFWSEEKLSKHKNSHSKQSSVRGQNRIAIKCPVKKILIDGVEEKCPHTFQVRRDLLKHLDDDHTPEDAVYKCEVCGRRFFWASGLRAHGQSVCARGGLACAWPGCTRVFRLPCRLREHARAHTGDRPYTCHYPNCGWAFRSASKLGRHARRHTGERRHACAACGRAFLRPEHLRDHARRHRPVNTRPTHRCAYPGCEQSFTNMSTLYMHMKKIHRKVENATFITNQTSNEDERTENIYVEDEASSRPEYGQTDDHAARTHCTWPLASRRHQHDLTFVLEDHVQVENAESSASNVYTVRSDLFLHGNVLIDDDSQNIGGGDMAEAEETDAPLDNDLCLIDSHPTVDLMQEELMYEDAAVDESSFRVFLMNGEELT